MFGCIAIKIIILKKIGNILKINIIIIPITKNIFSIILKKLIPSSIPGSCGAWNKLGFKNVTVVDISPTIIDQFKVRVIDFPKNHILNLDFFELTGQFDLIIEQTFFCAIIPSLRSKYVEQAKRLLKPTGKIVGLMFDAPLNEEHPPYGGSCDEYRSYFSSFFDIKIMDSAYNSIESRIGKEVFVKMVRK